MSRLVFDDSYVKITDEIEADWKEFYPDAKEDIPTNVPEARGREVQMIVFVDADHAGDKMTRRSRTGVLLYLNRSPIQWYSKRQNNMETFYIWFRIFSLSNSYGAYEVIEIQWGFHLMGQHIFESIICQLFTIL
jgi:hypothetical protein